MSEDRVCISRWVVRGALLALIVGVVAGLVQQAPDIRRYIKIEGM